MGKDQPYLLIEDRRGKHRRLPLPAKGAGFRLERRGNLTLIFPEGAKQRFDEDERPFRSLAYSEKDKQVRSIGLPKFHSPGKDPAGAAALEAELANPEGQVVFVRKYDGCLIIRSLDRGQVFWRTRTAFDLEHYGDPVLAVVRERYPKLLDPSVTPELSLQFEFISPKTRVVLPYAEDDLILVGATDNRTLRPLSFYEVAVLGDLLGLRVAEDVSLNGKTIAELQAEVNSDPSSEGVVARFGESGFLRIKADHYVSAFRQRFELHPRRIVQALDGKERTEAQLLSRLGISDTDPLAGYVCEIKARYEQLIAEIAAEMKRLQGLSEEWSELTRKRFAEQAHALGVPYSLAVLALRDGKRADAERLLRDHLLKDRFGDPTEVV